MNTPEIEKGALSLADLAFTDTPGSSADKVHAAIWAYEWAKINKRDLFGWETYPSLDELTEALTKR